MSDAEDDVKAKLAISGPYEKSIDALVGTANKFVDRLLGPFATELGELFADGVRHWRARRAIKLVLDCKERLTSRDVTDVRGVPPRILIPLLEAASLETDPTLSEYWTELLASAADPHHSPVPAVFASILADLSPLEARLMNWLYSRGSFSDSLNQYHAVARKEDVLKKDGEFGALDGFEFKVIVANLCRLGLIEPQHHVVTRSGGSRSTQLYDQLVITPLGSEFVRACRAR